MADITLRALDVLRGADVIACEDTRVTAKLLGRYGIDRPTLAYYDHNAAKVRPRLLARLGQGEVVALVSDAGTPLVSDPGFKLVEAALEAGIAIFPLPGPSSVMAALSVAGLPTDRFLFAGFLANRSGGRRRELEELKAVQATLVFFESAKRLAASLSDMAEVLGPRRAAVARELTKKFEEVRRERLDALADHYAAAGAPKGEVVVVVGPPEQGAATQEDIDAALLQALENLSVREAVECVTEITGAPRRQVYSRALELSKRR
jgi:16S rRNA (cytidine1402-2'-O)-methyltransferase